MKIRIKKYLRRRRKRGRGIPYIYNNNVYLGKKQNGSGIVQAIQPEFNEEKKIQIKKKDIKKKFLKNENKKEKIW